MHILTYNTQDDKYTNNLLERYKEYLSADEFSRYFSIKNEVQKRSFLVARGELKTKLSAFLGIKPEDIKFSYTNNGKPYIYGNSLYFSISHCNNLIALAISQKNIGIDIELPKVRNFYEISRKMLNNTISEAITVSQHPEELFYQAWTTLEALIKYHDSKLFDQLQDISKIYVQDSEIMLSNELDYKVLHTKYENSYISIICQR